MRFFRSKPLARRAMLVPLLLIVLAVTACSSQGFAIRTPGSFVSSLDSYHFSRGGLAEVESITSVSIGFPVWYKIAVKGIQPGHTVLTFTYEDHSTFSALLRVDDNLRVTAKEKAFDADSRLEDSELGFFKRIKQWHFNLAYQSLFSFYLVGFLQLLLILFLVWVLFAIFSLIAAIFNRTR